MRLESCGMYLRHSGCAIIAQVEAQSEPVDGLEELVKHVELNGDADAQTHLQRAVPTPPSVAAAAAAPPAPETGTGLLQVNRPVVLLGKDAAASTSLGSGRLQSRAKVLACDLLHGGRLCACGLIQLGVRRNRPHWAQPRRRRVWVEPPSCRLAAALTLTLTTFRSRCLLLML